MSRIGEDTRRIHGINYTLFLKWRWPQYLSRPHFSPFKYIKDRLYHSVIKGRESLVYDNLWSNTSSFHWDPRKGRFLSSEHSPTISESLYNWTTLSQYYYYYRTQSSQSTMSNIDHSKLTGEEVAKAFADEIKGKTGKHSAQLPLHVYCYSNPLRSQSL